MAICYSSILSLLFLLLITHWTNTASLHSSLCSSKNKFLDYRNSSIINNEYLKSKSILSQLPLIKRLRRWITNRDNDEVEIPIDETIQSVNNNSDDISLLNSTMNNTLLNIETIESNSSINDLINSTISFQLNMTTMIYPLLRKDLSEQDQINISIIENVLQDNKTIINNTNFSSTVFNEFIIINSTNSETFSTDINQVVINEKNQSITNQIDNPFQSSSSVPIILNQTTDQVEPANTTIILSDYTTVSYNVTEVNQTNGWGLSFNDKTETILYNDSFTVTTINEFTINSNISEKDAIITDQEIYINDTEIILIETNQNLNETSNLSSKSITIPICDHSCQCLKECPYGFEIFNDTCQCDPPCKNYPCFGNDTCIVTDKGQPLCQPENGGEYNRPIRCYQPRDAGYHDNNIRYYNRWYYNPDQDTCHLFVYRGMGGNENNFQTLHECHLECITCAPLPDSGECLGHIDMWYYDRNKNECKQFEYSGCKGNENKFLKKEQCIDTCINRIYNLK